MSLEFFNLIQANDYVSLVKRTMKPRSFDSNAFDREGHTLLHAAVLSESEKPNRLVFIDNLLKNPYLTRINDRSPRTSLTAYATAVQTLDFPVIEVFEKSLRQDLDLIYTGRVFGTEKELILEELFRLVDKPCSASMAGAVMALKDKVEKRSLAHAIKMNNMGLLTRLTNLYEGDEFLTKHESSIREMLLDNPECMAIKAHFLESSPITLPIAARSTWIPQFFKKFFEMEGLECGPKKGL